MRDTIYREEAIEKIAEHLGIPAENWMKIAEEWIKDVPSVAQPEEIALHESCTDCPLYDKDRHSCPRFNKVIPETLREVQSEQRWIPCSKKLPELNRSVLVQLSDDFVDPIQIMTLNISKCEGDFFCSWRTQEMGIDFDMDDVVAWMPLPTPWEGDVNEHSN